MLIIIKSSHDTAEARRAVKLARDMAADLLLVQNGVYLARKDALEGFCGTVHVLEEDLRLRGIKDVEKDIRTASYDDVVDLLAAEEKVVGAF